MMNLSLLRVWCVGFLACAAALHAAVNPFAALGDQGPPEVSVDLIPAAATAAPGGRVVIGVRFRMQGKWHVYWRNPGDSGLAPQLTWTLPPDWRADPLQWPTPELLRESGLISYAYGREVVFPVQLHAPATATASATAKLAVDYLACDEACVKGSATRTLRLHVDATPSATPAEIVAALARLPTPLATAAAQRGLRAAAHREGDAIILRLMTEPGQPGIRDLHEGPPASAASDAPASLRFLAAAAQGFATRAQQLRQDNSAWSLTIPLTPQTAEITRLRGILVRDGDRAGQDLLPGIPAVEFDLALPAAPSAPRAASTPASASATTPSSALDTSFLSALWLAFVGGLILNVFPCVLPVLILKALALAKFADRSHAVREGLLYTAGILVAMLALAGLLLVLRSAGSQLGWGFQMQYPSVIAGMAALMVLIAANLGGFFDVGLAATRVRLPGGGAFASGLLAVIVATPCSLPFMATAMGYALVAPAVNALAVFASLGLGLAAPMLVLGFSPALARFLPKPGAWMEHLRRILAFPMLLVPAWLAGVFAAQTGPDGLTRLLIGLTLIAAAGYAYGRIDALASKARTAVLLTCAGVLALAAVVVLIVAARTPPPPPLSIESTSVDTAHVPIRDRFALDAWHAWSPERVAALREAGIPVFVDVTAAWCLTCITNKKFALDLPHVEAAFIARGVVRLRADQTRSDPRIDALVAEQQRAGIPLNLLYVPGETTPRLLPGVLTPGIVLEALAPVPETKPGTKPVR